MDTLIIHQDAKNCPPHHQLNEREWNCVDFVTQCEKIAQDNFLVEGLRPAQREVLELIDAKKNVLATLPTGSGKTLLYAAPSLVFQNGIVLVISPLISLMRDQARRMNEAKVPCVIFTSEQSEEERKNARLQILNNKAKIIFASPERFVLPSFLNLISKKNIAMAVVDEAHCVVSWGHQFRPEYSEIGNVLKKLSPERILAITATASRNSRLQIMEKVFPEKTAVAEFTSQPLSPHIYIKSTRLFSHDAQWENLVQILSKTASQKSIVYFSTRKQCEEFAQKLRRLKILATVYHAGLTKQERFQTEQYIHTAKQKIVICATTAFGMGVDISGILLVVIYGFPGNIEEFFQMMGRAGRAGEKSQGILLWTGSDPIKRQYQFKSSFPPPSSLIETACNALTYFPKNEGESILLSKELFLQALTKSKTTEKGKNISQLLKECEGILSGLRICGVLEEPTFHESYYQIQFHKDVTLSKLITELPNAITKRKKVLESFQEFLPATLFQTSGCQVALPLSLILESSELTEQTLVLVLEHYQQRNSLQFHKITPSQSEPYVILKHNFMYLQKQLTKYITARNHFSSSLQELEKLSTATHCRLASSFDFFSSRSLQGGSKKSYFCMQCDLCLEQKKGISKNAC